MNDLRAAILFSFLSLTNLTFRRPSLKVKMRRIVICGGGIMGCATAFYLSELMAEGDGDVSVLVVDCDGEAASQASGKAGGFLASDWSTGFLGLLAQKSFELHSGLADALGAETIGYRSVSVSDQT